MLLLNGKGATVMQPERKPWDQRLLERMQRGNDRVDGSPWSRLAMGLALCAMSILNGTGAWPPGVAWPLIGAFLALFGWQLVAKLRRRRSGS